MSNVKMSREATAKVAKLARLSLSENEEGELSKVLSAVLENFIQISTIDTEGVEAMITPIEIKQRLREDESLPSPTREELLDCAADKSGRLFKVPPVV